MTTLDGPTTAVVSLHAVWAPTDARARRLALLTVLRRKGRILDAMAHNAEALRGRLDPETKAIVDELAQVRAKLAAATAGSLGAVAAVPSPEARVALERDAQRLEAAASARSAEVSATEHAVTIESVAGAIPEGAALVEVVYYRPYNPKVSTTIATLLPARYAAYALWRSGESAWTDLGEAEPIDKAAAHVRDAFASPARTDAKDAARALDEKVGRPIRAMLGGSHEVLLALDGALQLVPFGALVMEDGKFFLERFAVTYVTTGRDLLRFGDRSAPRSSPLVVANPTFDVPGAPAGKPFTPLPGTDGEATRLAVLLPGAVVLRGEAATKAALTAAHGPRILHVATHGFFLDDASRDARNTRGLELDTGAASSAAVAARPNPLLRAGLGLAGANAVGDRSAGILTALEASGLDLWGTKLVVLSACETGIGEVHNGEGVYGLRRSFLMSGAETLVMSMWKVDDEATRDLMADYYGQLQRGGGRGEALRRAQLAMLVTPARAHPYFWASFIAAGNPATLDGGRDAPQSVAPGAGAKLESHGCACDVAQREGGGSGGAWVALTLGLALARRRRFPIH
jgi:MYXO-CTERM domain-containing protein